MAGGVTGHHGNPALWHEDTGTEFAPGAVPVHRPNGKDKKGEKTPFRKIVILEKLLLCEISSSTANKMRGARSLQNIDQFIGGYNLFWTRRTYLLDKGEKTPFRKIVILEKLLLCEMSSSKVNKMRSPETVRNIYHFISGHNYFQTKRTYLLNKAEKTPFRKIVILLKLLLCGKGKHPSFFVITSKHIVNVILNCVHKLCLC